MAAGTLMLSGVIDTGEGQGRNGSQSALWPTVTSTMRPWTRWWWHGNAVDKPNLTRLLEIYRQAGIGGVEVTSIYGIKGQDAREIPYLSPGFVAMLAHTCAEAHRLDMGVDLPPGSGWRIGGPSVPIDLASANVVIETHALAGGERLHLASAAAHPQAVIAYGPDQATLPLTDKIDADGRLDWVAPLGDWTVYILSQKFSGSKVKRPGPGGSGNSIDPFSQRSLEAGLKPFGGLFAQLPPGAIRAQFHDSYEYEGNWTPDLLSEFRSRCGYDLQDHLPALLGKGDADEGERVRNDYRHVMGELLLDRVITPWVEQAHRHGQLARNQAHGSPGNLLDLYAVSDIPETEVFGVDRAPLMTMFASSSAHVMGRPLASSETGTWIAEHFTETLAEFKAEADMLFCAGINHIFYQGTAYSPADAAWPGWVFYASIEMNPSNPVWHDAPALNAYITRCQSLLQSGKPDNDILLYWPERDVWGGESKPLLRQLTVHTRAWFEHEPFGKTAQILVEQGYTLDYISDRQISLAQTGPKGLIIMPGGRYWTVLVPPCRTMPIEILERLSHLAEGGATILFQNGFPTDVPGWKDLSQRRERLHALITAIQRTPIAAPSAPANKVQRYRVGRGEIRISDDLITLLEHTGVTRERSVENTGLAFIRRRNRDGAFYFVVNRGKSAVDQWVSFASMTANIFLMDPMTGRVGKAATLSTGRRVADVYLQLAPGESIFVRSTGKQEVSIPAWHYWQNVGPPQELTGNWLVTFIEGGPETPPAFQTAAPASWTKLGGAQVERFAGTARYTTHFTVPSGVKQAQLDLGKVCQSARVHVNGKPVGTLLSAPFQVIVDNLKTGDNLLEVEVTSVAANRIRDLDRRGVNWKIFKDINFVSIDYKPFNAADWPLTDCGLLGPVTLQPVAFVDLNDLIATRYEALGKEKVETLFGDEHTHTNAAGAEINADRVVVGLKSLKSSPFTAMLAPNPAGVKL
ncbi:MAG: glycoside hydrolase family 2 sugar binding protein [Chthonomonadaceae bacterium]|nr:glycoside hydrolase family 2 sugar binding protein [Chthonomonadaceae bacterium]